MDGPFGSRRYSCGDAKVHVWLQLHLLVKNIAVKPITLITGKVISWEFVLFDSCMVAELPVITVDHDFNSA